jgi:hypothetical protein
MITFALSGLNWKTSVVFLQIVSRVYGSGNVKTLVAQTTTIQTAISSAFVIIKTQMNFMELALIGSEMKWSLVTIRAQVAGNKNGFVPAKKT